MPTQRQQIESQVDWAVQSGKIPATDRQKHIDFLVQNQDFYANALAGGAHFTKKSQEMADERRRFESELQAERSKIEAQRAELGAWNRDARAEVERANQIQADYQRMIAENARYKQLAQDYQIADQIPQDQIPPAPQPRMDYRQPPQQTPPRDPNTGRFLSREEGENFAQGVINMTGGAMAAAAEHFRLFGTPLADNIMQEAVAAGAPDVKAYWETKYNVEAKRTEMAAASHAAEIERIRTEERQKLMSEFAVDPSRFTGNPGPYQPSASPLANAYMNSRAADMNPVSGQEGTPAVAPEKRSDLANSREHVRAGAEMFNKHFNPDGTLRSGVKPPSSWAPVDYSG